MTAADNTSSSSSSHRRRTVRSAFALTAWSAAAVAVWLYGLAELTSGREAPYLHGTRSGRADEVVRARRDRLPEDRAKAVSVALHRLGAAHEDRADLKRRLASTTDVDERARLQAELANVDCEIDRRRHWIAQATLRNLRPHAGAEVPSCVRHERRDAINVAGGTDPLAPPSRT